MNKTNSIKKEDDFSLDELGDILSGMPLDVANLQLPSPELRNYYRDEQSRIIRISGEINDYTIGVVDRILYYNSVDKNIPVEERKPIKIYIDSEGGVVNAAKILVQVIKLSKTPIYGITMGLCASAASMIFLACHKRYCLGTSTFLIHQGSCSNLEGSYSEINAFMQNYRKEIEELAAFYKEHTNYEPEYIDDKLSKGDWYISTDEAISNGLVDEIVSDLSVLF